MQSFLNARTIAFGALALIALFAVFPAAIGYLPLLLLLGCPLMMIFMHGSGGHAGHAGHQAPAGTRAELGEYVCPMHPEVRSTFPGKCPLCGMELEMTEKASSGHR